jgi:hypothetical protein
MSGQIDAYSIEDCHLYDYKTSKDKNIEYIKKSGPKADHVWQVSIYKTMMEEKYPVDKVSVVYLSMSEFYVCSDVFTYSNEITKEFIATNSGILRKAFETDTPPPKPKPKPTWLCNVFCPVQEMCES